MGVPRVSYIFFTRNMNGVRNAHPISPVAHNLKKKDQSKQLWVRYWLLVGSFNHRP